MSRTLKIPFSRISNSQTLTAEIEARFKAEGLDLHVHEVEQMDDDDRRKERILRIKNTRYFFQ